MRFGKHYTNIEQVLRRANQIARDFVSDLGAGILKVARMVNPSKKIIIDNIRTGPTTETIRATGPAASFLAFDYQFVVPIGGFKPRPGSKAIMMFKPEGVVFRARSYSKHSGETIKRTGFLDEGLRQRVQSQHGKRGQKDMNEALGGVVANAMKDFLISRMLLDPSARLTSDIRASEGSGIKIPIG